MGPLPAADSSTEAEDETIRLGETADILGASDPSFLSLAASSVSATLSTPIDPVGGVDDIINQPTNSTATAQKHCKKKECDKAKMARAANKKEKKEKKELKAAANNLANKKVT